MNDPVFFLYAIILAETLELLTSDEYDAMGIVKVSYDDSHPTTSSSQYLTIFSQSST